MRSVPVNRAIKVGQDWQGVFRNGGQDTGARLKEATMSEHHIHHHHVAPPPPPPPPPEHRTTRSLAPNGAPPPRDAHEGHQPAGHLPSPSGTHQLPWQDHGVNTGGGSRGTAETTPTGDGQIKSKIVDHKIRNTERERPISKHEESFYHDLPKTEQALYHRLDPAQRAAFQELPPKARKEFTSIHDTLDGFHKHDDPKAGKDPWAQEAVGNLDHLLKEGAFKKHPGLLDQIDRLNTGKAWSGFAKNGITGVNPQWEMTSLVNHLGEPRTIYQGAKSDYCVATSALNRQAMTDPTAYARETADLMTKGETRWPDGSTGKVDVSGLKQSDKLNETEHLDRSFTDNLTLSTLSASVDKSTAAGTKGDSQVYDKAAHVPGNQNEVTKLTQKLFPHDKLVTRGEISTKELGEQIKRHGPITAVYYDKGSHGKADTTGQSGAHAVTVWYDKKTGTYDFYSYGHKHEMKPADFNKLNDEAFAGAQMPPPPRTTRESAAQVKADQVEGDRFQRLLEAMNGYDGFGLYSTTGGGTRGTAETTTTGGGKRGTATTTSTGGGHKGTATTTSTGGGARGTAETTSTGGGQKGTATTTSTGGGKLP